MPNLGDYESPGAWPKVLEHYRGTALRAHFERVSKGELRSVLKPQDVDRISDEPFTALDYVLAAGPGDERHSTRSGSRTGPTAACRSCREASSSSCRSLGRSLPTSTST